MKTKPTFTPNRPVFSFAGNTNACFPVAFSLQQLYFKLLNQEVRKDSPLFAEAKEQMETAGLRIVAPLWFADCFEKTKFKTA